MTVLRSYNGRYICPRFDFGFKRLFATESNKDLLISFLNAILDGYERIRDVTFTRNEHIGMVKDARNGVFDIQCENDRGEKIIVEMQNSNQPFFKDRSIYYATFPIQEQAVKGIWNFELKGIYTIGILDFEFSDSEGDGYFNHEVKLLDVRNKHVCYDKLTFFYLELPKFGKRAEELVTMLDKWMFLLCNLEKLDERPAPFTEPIFDLLFREAEIANFSEREYLQFESNLKHERDSQNIFDFAIEKAARKGERKGLKQGIQQGIQQGLQQGIQQGLQQGIQQGENQKALEIALRLKSKGLSDEDIASLTGVETQDLPL